MHMASTSTPHASSSSAPHKHDQVLISEHSAIAMGHDVSITSSPMSDSDKLSFAAATAMMMAPPTALGDDHDLPFSFAFGDDDSSDSHESVKTEDSGSGCGGRRALTPDERRERRNAKERDRVKKVKARIDKLRKDAEELEHRYDELHSKLEERVVVHASSDADIQARVAAYLTQAGTPQNARDAALLRECLLLEKITKQLQVTKRGLEDQLRPRVAEAAALSAVLGVDQSYILEQLSRHSSPTNNSDLVAVDPLDTIPPIRMDAVSLFEAMLAEDPLTPDEARGFVEDACREMMEGVARRDWVEGFEGFGWRGSRRLDVDGQVLQFRLSQQFAAVSASVLVQKTWTLLTNLESYQRIQPHTQQLRVIQRVNDECWVIGITVGQARLRLGQVLVARAIIHGGFLITFCSLPLVRKGRGGSEDARRRFVETETGGMHVDIHSWYNFQERPNADGGVDCEVIFGGKSRHGNHHYLQLLQTEVFAGITRWQSAVGFSNFILHASSVTEGEGEGEGERG